LIKEKKSISGVWKKMNFTKSSISISVIVFAIMMAVISVSALETWFEIHPEPLPPERAAFGMVYDLGSERPIIFGGFNPTSGALDDTWAYQGNEWVEIKVSNKPGKRYFHTFTYDPNKNTGILIGGISDTGVLSDAWKYQDETWSLITSYALPGRHSHAAAFNSYNNTLYIYGGMGDNNTHLSDFWQYQIDEGGGTWSMLDNSGGPGALYGHSMAYDTYRNQIVLFGGADEFNNRNNDTWIYKNDQWVLMDTFGEAPNPMMYHKMIYVHEKEHMVLFGGFEEGKRVDDLWIFDGEKWTYRPPVVSPPARSSHEIIFDSKIQRIYCVGGIGIENNYWDDMWVLYEMIASFDKETYSSIHDRASITISDLSSNLNPNAIDTISVVITSDTDPVGISIFLSETDNNTGIFKNDDEEQKLGFSLTQSNQDQKQILVSDSDTVYALYTSPSEGRELTATAVWQGMQSVMMWDKPIYIGYQDKAVLTVDNNDVNLDPNAIETITIKVSSDAYPTGINVVLTEISGDSGIFSFPKGAKGLTFHPKYSNQGKVEIFVKDGDTLRMSYENPYTGITHSSAALWIRSTVRMEFDKDMYTGDEKANLILYDSDLNFNPELAETVWLQIISNTDPVGMGIPAYETGPNTGVFDPGAIGFSTSGTSFSARSIYVTDGDVVSVIHSLYLKHPIYANTKWVDALIAIQKRPAVFIIFGPKEDEVTTGTEIIFHFTAVGDSLKIINPRDVEYKTKIVGYETEWTPWIQGTTRTYKDLPTGEYTFAVQCRGPRLPGEENQEGYLLSTPEFRHFYVMQEGDTPLTPPELVATPGYNFVDLTWTHPYRNNLLGYYIYRREEGQNIAPLNTLPLAPTVSNYSDGPMMSHKRYEYFVRAVNLQGMIKDSNKVWCSANEDVPGNDTLFFTEDIIDMGNNLMEVEIEIYNVTQTEKIYWTLYTETPALSITPASGESMGETTKVKIKLDRRGFAAGVHELKVHIKSTAASYFPTALNEEKAIRIQLSIPGDVVYDSHGMWTDMTVESYYEGVWVDYTHVEEENYRTYKFVNLGSLSGRLAIVNDKRPGSMELFYGDRNGQIDAGEQVTVTVGLVNTGKIEARSVTMVIYSSDEFIEILNPNSTMLNNIPSGIEIYTDIKFLVSKNLPPTKGGYPFTLYGYLVDSDGYQWWISLDLKAFNYPLRSTYTIDDDTIGWSIGNNNNIIESAEKIEIPITSYNPGVDELPRIVYYLDQVTSPLQAIILGRSSFKSKYPIPPRTAQNVETDFEFTVDQIYTGNQIDFLFSSAYIKPVLYDEYSIPENYLCFTNFWIHHPDLEKLDPLGEPLMCPVFQYSYCYIQEKKFAENRQTIQEAQSRFDNDTEGWTPQLDNPPFSSPEAGSSAGSINLKTLNNTDCHGFWESLPEYAPIIKDSLYRARCTIRSDQADSSLSPAFRLRAFDNIGQQADILVVASEGSGVCAPGINPRDYDLYFIPSQSASSLRFAWDIINFNPNDAPVATLYLDNLIIERANLDILPTPVRTRYYNFFESEEGWEYSTIPNFFTPAIGQNACGVLQITGVDSNTFGSWANPRLDIIQGENLKLYSAAFTMRTDLETPKAQVPQVRLRMNALNHQYAILKNINSEGIGDNLLDDTNKTYTIFCYSPTDQDGNPVKDIPLQVYIDYINFNASDYANATVKIDEVSVEVYPPDTIP
jgi:hypothetical protein